MKGDRQFLVFSDDINWCRENLEGLASDRMDFVQTGSHWHDMAIMTFCDAHIISASSFAWWGAWLSHTKPGKVVAPDPWFPAGSWDGRDVVPDRWIKLKV
jgi:hypothetical protein